MLRPVRAGLVAVLVTLVVAAGCSRRSGLEGAARATGEERAAQARRLAHDAGLGDDVGAFLATAAGAVGRSFTVEYDTGDGGRVTVAQDPPRRRVDLTGGSLASTVRTAVVNGDGSFSCEKTGDSTSCVPAADPPPTVGPFASTDLERTVSSLGASVRSFTITVEPRVVVATPASCLVTVRRPEVPPDPDLGARGELCVARSTGAPLLIDQPEQHLSAVRYRVGVAAGAFTLPGPLVTTSTTR
jgi:hypothetical protein